MTNIPQKIRKATNTLWSLMVNMIGEIRQQIQERANAQRAVFLVPPQGAMYPLITQDTPPIPIIRNVNTGILKTVLGCSIIYVFNMTGTKAQKAYNSHIWPK